MVKIRTELLEQYAEAESSLETSDASKQPAKVVKHALKSGIASLQVKEMNQESEEMSIREERDRLAKEIFSHDRSGSNETEDLSDNNDRSIAEIQADLKRRIFDD